MTPEERAAFRRGLRREAFQRRDLEWADDRVRDAIEAENGPHGYMAIVQRAIRARVLAVLQEGRKVS